MRNSLVLYAGFFSLLLLVACEERSQPIGGDTILLKDVTLIDGTGSVPVPHMDIRIAGDSIAAIGEDLADDGATVISLAGKTVLPALISAHVHIGTVEGTQNSGAFYTRTNILRQLDRYAQYGVTNIMVMGTDRPMLFESGLRDSSVASLLPGARIHTAGYGFGVPDGAPPMAFAMDKVFRPSAVAQVEQQLDSLMFTKPEGVKIWVDDFGGKFTKMAPPIYQAIIAGAHKRGWRVAAHLYYLSDARKLVEEGVDIIAHSIRDSVIDDATVAAMKARGTVYIPTLSLDEYAYIYARQPDWIDDPFFKASLEPGVYAMITSDQYRAELAQSPAYAKNIQAFETALLNLKKLHDGGVQIALGTDSGAIPLRAQGFSEHLELELMVQAGLTPLQAITVATSSAAHVLRIDDNFGTLQTGKKADLLIVDGDPSTHIKDTRKIVAVYKAGRMVSDK